VKRALVFGLLCAACHAPNARHAKPTTIENCDYRISFHAEGRARVEAACRADGPITFRVAAPYLRDSVKASKRGKSGRYVAPSKRLSYEVDLKRLARADDFDRAKRVGASFVGTLSSVLLVPEPLTSEIPVTVRIEAAPDLAVAVGLRRGKSRDSYELMAHEIPVATYFAFGKLERQTLHVAGGRLELSRLDGPFDPSFDELSRWVETSAHAVSDFYRAFPVPRVSLTIIPAPARDEVVFGKVLPESEPGIALVIGQHASKQALYSDWILVHELFHLGFPSLSDKDKWLDEGLATYYEPVIRARAGLYSELELWSELSQRMPEGLPAFTEHGLEHADDFHGIYWGGAIACLLADVEARRRDPARGLEVGLRALREAGGTAAEVWSLDEVIGVVDRALKAPILASVVRAHAKRGTRFDLTALFTELGVTRDAHGDVQLSDEAPLAAVRRAITSR
jgi:hypothetical protein